MLFTSYKPFKQHYAKLKHEESYKFIINLMFFFKLEETHILL